VVQIQSASNIGSSLAYMEQTIYGIWVLYWGQQECLNSRWTVLKLSFMVVFLPHKNG